MKYQNKYHSVKNIKRILLFKHQESFIQVCFRKKKLDEKFQEVKNSNSKVHVSSPPPRPSLVEKSPGGKLAADTIPGRSQYTQHTNNCTWNKIGTRWYQEF